VKVEFINPFINAGVEVLGQFVSGEVEQGQLAIRTAVFTSQQISIVVGVSGSVRGQVIYGMSQVTAIKIASAMMGTPQVEFDEMAISAINELGNIISGNALSLLASQGYECDITPPAIVRGVNVELATAVPALVIPINTPCGKFEVNVALTEG
jgi:chemotaxis protein CheX